MLASSLEWESSVGQAVERTSLLLCVLGLVSFLFSVSSFISWEVVESLDSTANHMGSVIIRLTEAFPHSFPLSLLQCFFYYFIYFFRISNFVGLFKSIPKMKAYPCDLERITVVRRRIVVEECRQRNVAATVRKTGADVCIAVSAPTLLLLLLLGLPISHSENQKKATKFAIIHKPAANCAHTLQ